MSLFPTDHAIDDAEARTRQQQVLRFKLLTEVALPERARAKRWPLRLDHCFKRVCLDYATGDVWYRHLRKPAEKHMHGAVLERAVQCAEDLFQEGRPLLEKRNRESLRFRGKLKESATESFSRGAA